MLDTIKVGTLIQFKYIYSNSPYQIGIVYKKKQIFNKDLILYIFINSESIEKIPASLAEYELL